MTSLGHNEFISASVLFAAMSDLIRLVHGNIWSIQKVIKEFRAFWSGQTKEEAAAGAADTSINPTDGGSPVKEEAMEVDTNGKATPVNGTNSTSPSPKNSGDGQERPARRCISKRQLDICIRGMAVYEKRDCYEKRRCWYVHNAVLEKYSLKDLPVPTEWQWITRKNKVEEVSTGAQTPRSGTPVTGGSSTPVHPSIKQFTVPSSQLPSPALVKPSPLKPEPSSPGGISSLFSPIGNKSLTSTPKSSPVARKDKSTPITLFCKKINEDAASGGVCTPIKNSAPEQMVIDLDSDDEKPLNSCSEKSSESTAKTETGGKSTVTPTTKKTPKSDVSTKKVASVKPVKADIVRKMFGASKNKKQISVKPVETKNEPALVVNDDDDDDCMIVGDSLPSTAPKGQPTMMSMFGKK